MARLLDRRRRQQGGAGVRRRVQPVAGPVPGRAGRVQGAVRTLGGHVDPAHGPGAGGPARRRRPHPAEPAQQRGLRRLPDRLLLLPVLRLRGLPARLLVPPAAAGRLHPRPDRPPRGRLHPAATVHRDRRVRPGRGDLPRGRPLPGRLRDPAAVRGRQGRHGHHHRAPLRRLRIPAPRSGRHRPMRELPRAAARDHQGPAPADHGPHRQTRPDLLRRGGTPPRRVRAPDLLPVRPARREARPDRRHRHRRHRRNPQPRLRRLGDDPGHQHRATPPRQPGRPRLPDRRDHGPLAQGERARRDPGRRRPGKRRQDQAQAAGHPLRGGPPQRPGHPAGRAGEPRDRDHRRDRAGARHRGRLPARGQRAVQRGPARSGPPGPGAVHRERRGRRRRAPPPRRRPRGAAQGRPHRPGDHALRPGHRRGGQRRPARPGALRARVLRLPAVVRQPVPARNDRPSPGPRPDAEADGRRGGTRVRSG